MSRYRKRPPFVAEPDPRSRGLIAASAPLRSPVRAIPAALVQRSVADADPARRPNGFGATAGQAGSGSAGAGDFGGGGGWGEER